MLDKATSDKLYKDVQSYRLITVSTLVDRLKINGSLARKALIDLEEKGQIKKVVGHSKLSVYSELLRLFLYSGIRVGVWGLVLVLPRARCSMGSSMRYQGLNGTGVDLEHSKNHLADRFVFLQLGRLLRRNRARPQLLFGCCYFRCINRQSISLF